MSRALAEGFARPRQRAAPAGRDPQTTVRVQDGQTVTTDGPYAASEEGLGAYFVFESDDIDGGGSSWPRGFRRPGSAARLRLPGRWWER